LEGKDMNILSKKCLLSLTLTIVLVSAHFLRSEEVEIEERAPNFTLVDLDTNQIVLSDIYDSNSVLRWFTNLCPGCTEVAPQLNDISKKYKNKNLQVLGISVLGEDRKSMEKFIKDQRLTFPLLLDPKGEATKTYTGGYIPEACPKTNLYLIDKEGIVRYATHFPGVPTRKLKAKIDQQPNSKPKK
jgi:peroxiredoxin